MDRTDQTRRTFPVCVVLAAVTLAAFWPVIHNDFVSYDDRYYVTENPHVLAGLTLGQCRVGVPDRARGQLASADVAVAHGGLPALRAEARRPSPDQPAASMPPTRCCSSALLKRLTGAFWRSALVAALFALHPLHVESVAWVAERKDVLSAFFFMLTLRAYARYAEVRVSPKPSPASDQKSGGQKSDSPQSTRQHGNTQQAARYSYLARAGLLRAGFDEQADAGDAAVCAAAAGLLAAGRLAERGRCGGRNWGRRCPTFLALSRLLVEKTPFFFWPGFRAQ